MFVLLTYCHFTHSTVPFCLFDSYPCIMWTWYVEMHLVWRRHLETELNNLQMIFRAVQEMAWDRCFGVRWLSVLYPLGENRQKKKMLISMTMISAVIDICMPPLSLLSLNYLFFFSHLFVCFCFYSILIIFNCWM